MIDKGWFLVMRQGSIVYALMELVGVRFVIKINLPTHTTKQTIKHGGVL
jgi:hypothetical protein